MQNNQTFFQKANKILDKPWIIVPLAGLLAYVVDRNTNREEHLSVIDLIGGVILFTVGLIYFDRNKQSNEGQNLPQNNSTPIKYEHQN
jgi:hypothetical protein